MFKINKHMYATADETFKVLKDGRKHLLTRHLGKTTVRGEKMVVVGLTYTTSAEEFKLTYEEAVKLQKRTGIFSEEFMMDITTTLYLDSLKGIKVHLR